MEGGYRPSETPPSNPRRGVQNHGAIVHGTRNETNVDGLLDPVVRAHGLPVLRVHDVLEAIADLSFHVHVERGDEAGAEYGQVATQAGEESRLQFVGEFGVREGTVPAVLGGAARRNFADSIRGSP